MRITYLDHSGFSVDFGSTLLIFDAVNMDAQGGAPELPEEPALRTYDRVYFFVSHEHADHFNYGIFRYADFAEYLLAPGVDAAENARVHVMARGDVYRDETLEIRAFGSTDLGVSFLVTEKESGIRLFHAGDLNCWHWTGEWSGAEEREAREAYDRELDFLAPFAGGLDAAFLPVDPRMQGGYDDGARIFAERFLPRRIFPMHCWGRYELLGAFREKMLPLGIDVCAPAQRGDQWYF